MQALLGLIGLLAVLGVLIMLPSAIASWYSKCLNIKLRYGFIILFSFVILSILLNSVNAPPNIKVGLFGVLSTVMAVLIIYGVFRQFRGKCNLGGIN